MDGWFHGKAYFLLDDLGVNHPYFWFNTHMEPKWLLGLIVFNIDSSYLHGQISSRPHTTDFPQKVDWGREMGPLILGKSRLVKYYSIWPDICTYTMGTCHERLVWRFELIWILKIEGMVRFQGIYHIIHTIHRFSILTRWAPASYNGVIQLMIGLING